MGYEDTLQSLGLDLPEAPKPVATYRNAGITVSPTFAYFDDAVRDTINELIARDARAKGEI